MENVEKFCRYLNLQAMNKTNFTRLEYDFQRFGIWTKKCFWTENGGNQFFAAFSDILLDAKSRDLGISFSFIKIIVAKHKMHLLCLIKC